MLIAGIIGLLCPPLALYALWRIDREQAEAVLANLQREVRLRADSAEGKHGD